MTARVAIADSLIGSLCREVDGIRQRCRLVLEALERCQNRPLTCRLQRELRDLQQRRLAVLQAARNWQRLNTRDSLALALLIELCRRPVTV
jgi:hypothetical protein